MEPPDQKGGTMKTLHLSVVFLLCLSQAAAQEQIVAKRTNSLLPNAWALQFQIASNFTLSSFQGASISWKWHTSHNKGIRIGITLNGSVDDVAKNTVNSTGGVPQPGQLTTQQGDSQDVAIHLQYLYYPLSSTSVTFFLGFGPVVSYSKYNSDASTELSRGNGAKVSTTEDREIWAGGGSALLGCEWFASKRISLHAEYGLELRYLNGKETYTFTTVEVNGTEVATRETATRRSWVFNPKLVRFGISVYF